MAFAGAALPGAALAAAAAGTTDGELLPLLLSAAADRSVRLWNTSTMQRLRVLYKRPAEVSAVAASRWVLGAGAWLHARGSQHGPPSILRS